MHIPRIALTDARVWALKKRKTTYDIRDGKLRGFGIRVLPSGAKRYFIHSQHRGRRVWKIVGEAGSIGADEARTRAKSLLAAIREGSENEAAAPPDIAFETIAEEVFRRYARNWKPSTLKVNRNYYRNHILPRFKGRPIADIDSRDVRQWFASLHAKPAAADRSAPILSVIMRQAEIYGYRAEGSNPCKGIKRYRREGRERFLSVAEMRSLAAVLDRFEADRPQQVAIIRLLLLTGCRASEVRTLKWRYRREGKLFLPDSKTGPRKVFLNTPARAVIERQPRTDSPFVFPSPRDPGRACSPNLPLWYLMRRQAGIEDVRLHDLRHTFASHAVLRGIPLPVVSRMLGHKRPTMTLRYAHVGDRETEAAAERIGAAIALVLSGRDATSSE